MSQHQKTFDFDNKLELSNTNKEGGKTFVGFEDFLNVGDRTYKSKENSFISKKELESVNNSGNILAFMTDHSIRNTRQNKKNDRERSNYDQSSIEGNQVPMFVQPTRDNEYQSIYGSKMGVQTSQNQEKPYSSNDFTLRRVKTPTGIVSNSPSQIQKSPSPPRKKSQNPPSPPKPIKVTAELEYKDIESKLNFYINQIDKLNYQQKQLDLENEELLYRYNSVQHQQRLNNQAKQIKVMNQKIESEKQLESRLMGMHKDLEEEYQGILTNIRGNKFKRPTIVKDEAKAIIDEINNLKAEFETVVRDQESLNFSQTLNPNQQSLNKIMSFNASLKRQAQNTPLPETKQISQILNEIRSYQKLSKNPKYLFNIKMCNLRLQWVIYEDSQLRINVHYRNFPQISILIGNKSIEDLQKFYIRKDGENKLEGEMLVGKSYIQHKIDVKIEKLGKMFYKFEVGYEKDGQLVEICLFVPSGLLNFGQFTPLTEKEFLNDPIGKQQQQFSTGYRPMDKKMISSVGECCIYFPNLIYNQQKEECYGLFVSMFNHYSLVVIRQKGDLISIANRSTGENVVKLLEFIFTV